MLEELEELEVRSPAYSPKSDSQVAETPPDPADVVWLEVVGLARSPMSTFVTFRLPTTYSALQCGRLLLCYRVYLKLTSKLEATTPKAFSKIPSQGPSLKCADFGLAGSKMIWHRNSLCRPGTRRPLTSSGSW